MYFTIIVVVLTCGYTINNRAVKECTNVVVRVTLKRTRSTTLVHSLVVAVCIVKQWY